MTDQQPVIYPSRTGKTFRQQLRIAAALRDGARVLFCDRDGQYAMSLADDGHTLIRTPVPAAEAVPIWVDELEEQR